MSIASLPEDLLYTIFQHCTRPTPTLAQLRATHGHSEPTLCPPIVLSHVCASWRALALHSPILWTTIVLWFKPRPREWTTRVEMDLAYRPIPFSSRRVHWQKPIAECALAHRRRAFRLGIDLLRVYSTRSKGRLLTVTFGIDSNGNVWGRKTPTEEEVKLEEDLVEAILSLGERLGTLALYLPDDWCEDASLVRLQASLRAPHLRSLDVSTKAWSRPWSSDPLESARMFASPMLTSFALATVSREDLQKVVASNTLPWARLTHLNLDVQRNYYWDFDGWSSQRDADRFVLPQAVPILKRCPNLVFCALRLETWWDGRKYRHHREPTWPGTSWEEVQCARTAWQEEPFALPFLRELVLRGAAQQPGLAATLVAPALRVLTVAHCTNEPEEVDDSGLVEWARVYGHQLTQVTFDYTCLTERALDVCLSHLTRVEDLRVVVGNWNGILSNRARRFGLVTWDEAGLPVPVPPRPSGVFRKLVPEFNAADGSFECYCPTLRRIECMVQVREPMERDVFAAIRARRNLHVVGTGQAVEMIREARVDLGFRREDSRAEWDSLSRDVGLGLEVSYAQFGAAARRLEELFFE